MIVLKNLSIRATLIVVLAGLILSVTLATVISARILNRANREIQTMRHQTIELALQSQSARLAVYQVQQWLTDISATRGLDGLDDGFSEAESWAEKFNTSSKHIMEILRDDPEHRAFAEATIAAFPPYYEAGKKMAQAYIDGGPEQGNLMMSDFDKQAERLNASVARLTQYAEQNLDERIAHLDQQFQLAQRVTFTFNLLLILGTLVMGVFIHRRVLIPLIKIGKQMAEIADGSGDLSQRILTTSNNEIGKLGQSFNRFNEQLENIIFQIRNTCGEMLNTSDLLSKSTDITFQQVESSNRETNALSRETSSLEMCIATISRKTEDGTQKLNEVSQSIQDLSDKISRVKSESMEIGQSAESAATVIEQLSATVSDIAESTNEASIISHQAFEQSRNTTEMVDQMSEKAKSVGRIIEVINKMAERTHLLALNANIEAARSGKFGLGFSVVANEVKELATETTEATGAIENEIRTMMDFSNSCKKAMQEVELYNRQLNNINESILAALREHELATTNLAGSTSQTVGAIQNVNQHLSYVDSHAQTIAGNTTLLDQQMKEIDQQSSEVKNQIRDIRKQVDNVTQAAQITYRENQSVFKQAEHVAKLNYRQKDLVNRFKLRENDKTATPL